MLNKNRVYLPNIQNSRLHFCDLGLLGPCSVLSLPLSIVYVTIEGDKSSTAKVTSGVPQGTVLGPLMFLLYINDIGNDITSKIRLFADDSLLYLAISTKDDCKRLQQDLDRMVNWTKT